MGEAEGGQRLQLCLRGARHRARRIDVFNAQPPQAAVMAGEQPAAEGGKQDPGWSRPVGEGAKRPQEMGRSCWLNRRSGWRLNSS